MQAAPPSPASPLHREVATLYAEHHGWVRAWLRRRMGDAHQAADLAHDVYMRLLTRDDVIEAREPRAFLTTVAQRVLSNHRRREKLEQDYLAALVHVPQALELSPEERAILLETLLEIDRLLEALPLVVRRTFLLTQIDGLSHAEVAGRLGISITTVKRYLVKAGQQCYFGGAADAIA